MVLDHGAGKTRALSILLTVDPEIPVPPNGYGGIERIVAMLERRLVEKGHEVLLLAHPDSKPAGRLIPYFGRTSRSRIDTFLHMRQVWQAYHDYRPDVVHSFGRLAYLLPILPSPLLKVQSYQRAVSRWSVVWGRRLSRGMLLFTACSADCAATAGDGGEWHPIFNGAPEDLFTPTETVPPDAPLVFLGRLERIKGPHTAIRVARASGRKLVLAGNVPSLPGAQAFFDQEIAPHLDGQRITYVGPVNDEQKNRLLGQAAALLMPIEWREPFGIVMAEALACGTPVIGFPLGAVPEVVRDGVNGFLCSNVDEMVQAVGKIGTLSRAACRRDFEERFSDRVLVEQYEALYREGLKKISRRLSRG